MFQNLFAPLWPKVKRFVGLYPKETSDLKEYAAIHQHSTVEADSMPAKNNNNPNTIFPNRTKPKKTKTKNIKGDAGSRRKIFSS